MVTHIDIFIAHGRAKALMSLDRQALVEQVRVQSKMLTLVTSTKPVVGTVLVQDAEILHDYVRSTMAFLGSTIAQTPQQAPDLLSKEDLAGAELAIKFGRTWLDKTLPMVIGD